MSNQFPEVALGPRFEQALVYAATLHAGQVRKSTPIPYVSHVLAVTAIALEHGANEDQAIAALLHDVVEDCGGKPRLADIRHRFGETVAEIVAGCTDADVTPKPPWEERKRLYIEHVKTAPPPVLLVSCSDKVHNARSIVADLRAGVDAFALFKGGKTGTLWYYRSLLEVFQQRDVPPRLVADLARSVEDMEHVANVR